MAARRPAKIASQKKRGQDKKVCPETGKTMIIAKIVRANGPNGMFWVHEDFDGSDKAIRLAVPVRLWVD